MAQDRPRPLSKISSWKRLLHLFLTDDKLVDSTFVLQELKQLQDAISSGDEDTWRAG